LAHPVDEHGLVLPEPSWPPGRHAPMPLEQLRRFVNSSNVENGAERFRSPADLERWLTAEGLGGRPVDAAAHERLLMLRGVLRDLALANNPECGPGDEEPEPDPARSWADAVDLVGDSAVRFAVEDGRPVLRPAGTGADAAAAHLLLIALSAVEDGTWSRLKSCGHCRWVFYDRSRNQAGAWCSMQACGGRLKARSYRRRQRARSED
jgi:predicted RNA-binding Zn ribbon-like protein